MGYFAFVEMGTGRVGKTVYHGDGSTPGPEDGYLIVETDAPAFAQPGSHLAYRGGELLIVPDDPSAEEAWEALRQSRNMILIATDWSQGSDVPEGIKSAYATYRQALRDLPANTADPFNPVWPAPPIV